MIIERNNHLTEANSEYTFKILSSGNASFGNEWSADIQSPPFTRIYYTISGEGDIKGEDQLTALHAGSICLIPSGYTYSCTCQDTMNHLFFHISLADRSGIDRLFGLGKVFSANCSPDHLDQILSLYASQNEVDHLFLKAILQSDLFALLRQNITELPKAEYSACVKDALEFIHTATSATLTVSEVANHVNHSPDSLAHKFKNEVGTPIGKFIDGLVMLKAENLLINSDLSIAQISNVLGFYDQFYFSRRFKERFSLSPQRYRKNYKRKI